MSARFFHVLFALLGLSGLGWLSFGSALRCEAAPFSVAEVKAQVVTLPEDSSKPLWVDVNGDGRLDLLVVDRAANSLLIYLQTAAGMAAEPAQVLSLPPGTAWVALSDVAASPGPELVMSAAQGVFYSKQSGAGFETERRLLLECGQAFDGHTLPVMATLVSNPSGAGDVVPVFDGGAARLYARDESYVWRQQEERGLPAVPSRFECVAEPWGLGSKRGGAVRVSQGLGAEVKPAVEPEPENDAVRAILADMRKHEQSSPPRIERLDVNRDGREDLLVWQMQGRVDPRTDLYLFLRGTNGQLPEHPTQVLHCSGLPIPIGNSVRWTPVGDIDGDGVCELVVLEPKTIVASPSGVVEMMVTQGLEWWLNVRPWRDGHFSTAPETRVPVRVMLSLERSFSWPVMLNGDFNGDGRLDLLVRASNTRWNVFCSTGDRRWLAPDPAFAFEGSSRGHAEPRDINGDGLSDIVWQEPESRELRIILSPGTLAKFKKL
jgi:hypothetical protein